MTAFPPAHDIVQYTTCRVRRSATTRSVVHSAHTSAVSVSAGPARVTPLTPSLAPEPGVQLTVALPPGPMRQRDWVDDLHELCRQLPGAAVEAR